MTRALPLTCTAGFKSSQKAGNRGIRASPSNPQMRKRPGDGRFLIRFDKGQSRGRQHGCRCLFRKPSGYEAYIRMGEIVKDLLLIDQPPGPWTPDTEPA